MNEHIKHLLSLPDTPRYNIKAVVQQTSVNISTLRAWEQRYGIPNPKRSEHGHRLYSQRDVAIIKWLRQCTEEGLAISQAVVMLREVDTTPSASDRVMVGVPAHTVPAPAGGNWYEIRAQLMECLDTVNLRQAHLLVNQICTMFPIDTVILDLFEPIMVRIGERWLDSEIGIAEEHMFSNFIRQRLLGLMQLHAPFAHGPRLICACAPEEQHELGLLMFALLMEQRGWEVVYLGQSMAYEGIEPFLKRLAPALMCISGSMVEHIPGMLELSRVVAALEPYRLRLAYSGQAFERYPELQARIPGIYLGTDLRLAVSRADQLGELVDPERWYTSLVTSNRL